LRPQHYECCAL